MVVKVGTSALTDDRGQLDVNVVANLAGQLAAVMRNGIGVTLVSSGAVGAGMGELGLSRRPRTLPLLQATAAVGQGQLMRRFHDAFTPFGVKVAQILVTRGDFESRSRYLNIRNTIAALQDLGAVPIINENDSVAVDELRFGDNDVIAAHVTNMVRAEVLVLLTVVDGVLADGQVLDVIEDAQTGAARLPTGATSKLGSGGMGSKLQAAHMVASAGEVAIVANGRTPDILGRLLAGEKLGTLCVPSPNKLSSRRRWIGQASRAAGRIVVDAGAVEALCRKGRSLLPSGVTAVTGSFAKGDTVAIVDARGRVVARGLSNYDAEQVDRIKGLKTTQIARALGDKPYDEVVHRNNMMIL
ncbi:MAG: glutamate 5-kinase [Planctomycetes bacterium]|nr:glutamate 5-kinase [Planctomycetota bacterium]